MCMDRLKQRSWQWFETKMRPSVELPPSVLCLKLSTSRQQEYRTCCLTYLIVGMHLPQVEWVDCFALDQQCSLRVERAVEVREEV